MGTTASKFKKNLLQGEEFAALHSYDRHPELRRCIDPNASLGEAHGHNTYLHLVCKHAMKTLLRIFLNELNADPNKKNAQDITALHLLCHRGSRPNAILDAKLRAECLAILLAWEGSKLANGQKDKINIDSVDNKGNTALHYAAANNLQACVELLVSRGAHLFLENDAHETACDAAAKEGYQEVASFLESKMVFCIDDSNSIADDFIPAIEPYCGLREQDLREAKDQLLVETSDMLHVPLFTAEALLRNHEWSREALLDSYMRDPVACCEKCGVHTPASLAEPAIVIHRTSSATLDKRWNSSAAAGDQSKIEKLEINQSQPSESIDNDQSLSCDETSTNVEADAVFLEDISLNDECCFIDTPLKIPETAAGDVECQICAYAIEDSNNYVPTVCEHVFCRICWQTYLHIKIQDGDLNSITCPAYACSKLVPVEIIEKVLSPEMARKYLKFDIKAFVDSNPKIKWCPFAGCTNAVRLPDSEESISLPMRVFPRMHPPPPTSRTVHCPSGHAFCWDCLSEGHEPTSCAKWKDWHDKVHEVKPEELKNAANSTETAANCLWLVTNSKPCPKCKAPIQKNEGCNHMKCSKCKHEFCWVCLGPWKKHGTDTGGFFRCNRYNESRKAEERNEQAIADAQEAHKKQQELMKFLHYYTRYKNHLNSYEMEKPLLDKLDSKLEHLELAARQECGGAGVIDTKFVKEAIVELLRSRKVLSSSYAYGYFLKDYGYNKTIFEYLQNELEVSTEALSALVARSYLRSSRSRIIHTTFLVQQKRQSFILCISRGLMPPETPPSLRKLRKRNLPGILGIDMEEDDWLKSLTGGDPVELDPDKPWVKDNRGRHRNLYALLNWDEQGDDDDEPDDTLLASPTTSGAAGALLAAACCSRVGCNRPRARNPRTGTFHSYCSLRCRYLATTMETDESTSQSTSSAQQLNNRSYNVDLMIALQMSRLQLLQDLKLLGDDEPFEPVALVHKPALKTSSCSDPSAPQTSVFGEEVDPDLQLAIERSMRDSVAQSEATVGAVSNTTENNTESLQQQQEEEATSENQEDFVNIDIKVPSNVPHDAQSLSVFLRQFASKETPIGKANLFSTVEEVETTLSASGLDGKVSKLLLNDVKQSIYSNAASTSKLCTTDKRDEEAACSSSTDK